jgi:hypothetical protein
MLEETSSEVLRREMGTNQLPVSTAEWARI